MAAPASTLPFGLTTAFTYDSSRNSVNPLSLILSLRATGCKISQNPKPTESEGMLKLVEIQ